MRYRKSEISRKILILLLGGIALGLTHSPKQYFKILSGMVDEWKGINKFSFKRTIKSLYHSGMLKEIKNKDGTISVVLSEKGREIAEVYSLDNLKIDRPKKWDGNWRVVIFDIPERERKKRLWLRLELISYGYKLLQKSVWVGYRPLPEDFLRDLEDFNLKSHIHIFSIHHSGTLEEKNS